MRMNATTRSGMTAALLCLPTSPGICRTSRSCSPSCHQRCLTACLGKYKQYLVLVAAIVIWSNLASLALIPVTLALIRP